MIGQTGPFEVECDAPAYDVVCASTSAGLSAPPDVRWCRLSRFASELVGQQSVWSLARRIFRTVSRLRPLCCRCGQGFPELGRFRFEFLGLSRGEYLLGQCRRCGTVYWEPLLPPDRV